jgi:hypothetical protein
MSKFSTLLAATALAAAASAALCSCASPPSRPADQPPPAASAGSAGAQEREVAWDESVQADFDREVPRFARKLAESKLEDMARDKGTFLVDRALYDEAMAQYKR